MKTEKIVIVFILLIFLNLNVSCVNYNNEIFFKKKVPNYTEVQLVKECEYKIDLEGYRITNQEIDSIIINNFKKKNIIITENKESKYKLFLKNLSFNISKERSGAMDTKGSYTGNFGNKIKVNIDIETLIINSENKKEKKISWNLSDIKPVHTDMLLDFFATDSEDKIKTKIMFESSVNGISHKVVKFILK